MPATGRKGFRQPNSLNPSEYFLNLHFRKYLLLKGLDMGDVPSTAGDVGRQVCLEGAITGKDDNRMEYIWRYAERGLQRLHVFIVLAQGILDLE